MRAAVNNFNDYIAKDTAHVNDALVEKRHVADEIPARIVRPDEVRWNEREKTTGARYVAEEVPPWIVSDETAAQLARGRSRNDVTASQSDVEDEEPTRKSQFVSPEAPEHPGLGQGSPGDGFTLRHVPSRAITPFTSMDLDAATQQRLRDANIVQLPDGTSR